MTEVRHRVRWKEAGRGDGRWRYGHVAAPPAIEGDGSVRVYAQSHGGARSLDPRRVYYQGRGPRGGQRWLPISELIAIIPATAKATTARLLDRSSPVDGHRRTSPRAAGQATTGLSL